MAAVLKKRALAEYSQVVQEEANKPLQLTKKPRQNSVDEAVVAPSLSKCKTNGELIYALNLIARSLPTTSEDRTALLQRLVDLYHQEKDSSVRVTISRTLGEFCQIPDYDIQAVANDLLRMLHHETSHKVRAEQINSLRRLGSLAAQDSPLYAKILAAAKQFLNDTNHLVKCNCLSLMGHLAPNSQFEAVSLISSYTRSQDPRVRTAAYNSMFALHERGQKLEMAVYGDVCQALDDDHENVRQAALRIICVLSHTYPESVVPIADSREEVRLVDDAFAKICRSISDLSVGVRTLAAELLGSMTRVNPHFLEQTLDKKLMSDMRRKRSAHERHWETVTSGEWASGARWAEDAPRENLDADSVSLIHSGACGAFVHGLEDEFLEVRSAALDSLCQLALSSPRFATLSLDFLVDMYNDEIEEVRLKAIDCMTRISRMIVLREDQLEVILSVLEDSNPEIREGLHRMLGACRLATRSCVSMVVQHLLDNLKRYAGDKRSIWRCLQLQGRRHPELVLLLTPQLLALHPFFDMPEPDVEDPVYVCVLLLVFNAAQHCPQILSLFEEHTKRHYRYLRDTIPTLVPALNLSGIGHVEPPAELETNTHYFLQNVMSRLKHTDHLRSNQIKVWETACQDLIRLAQIDGQLAHGVQLLATQLQCHLLMARVVGNAAWTDASGFSSQESGVVRNSIDQLQRLCLQLQYLFSNLTTHESLQIQTTRLQAMAVQLVYVVRASNASALALADHFVGRVEALQRESAGVAALPSFAEAVVKEMKRLDDTKPGVLSRVLLPILQSHVHQAPFCLPAKAVKLSAEILEPTGESDNPLKFLAGFVLGVPMDAEITGLVADAHDYLRLRVKYPDQHTQLTIPQESHLKLVVEAAADAETPPAAATSAADATSAAGPTSAAAAASETTLTTNPTPTGGAAAGPPEHRLRTTVLVSHQVWTEACHVEVSLVLDVTDRELPTAALRRWRGFAEDAFVVELCKPVRVLVSPKPVKRGI